MNTDSRYIEVGDLRVEIVRKDIKNAHLAVYPPHGRVRLAAPMRMTDDALRLMVVSRLGWLKRHRARIMAQERDTPREYVQSESHWFLGKRYLLKIEEAPHRQTVFIRNKRELVMQVRIGSTHEVRERLLYNWYRDQLRQEAARLMAIWAPVVGRSPARWGIKLMRTKWGSCNHHAQSIWLNIELARKPVKCLEYIVVHELVHLLEHTHNERFQAYMDRFMPDWQLHRKELNRLPIRHEDWEY